MTDLLGSCEEEVIDSFYADSISSKESKRKEASFDSNLEESSSKRIKTEPAEYRIKFRKGQPVVEIID